jgi:hypothetical protein
MTLYVLITFSIVLLLVFLLIKLSPFESDLTYIIPEINDEKQENIRYVEVEKIVEKPVEVIKEVFIEKPIEKIVEIIKEVPITKIKEDRTQIKNLQKELKKLSKQKNEENKIWRNIGLELYSNNNHDKFILLLNEVLGKKIIVGSSSTFVLGANYKGYKIFEGIFSKYEILENRKSNSPIVRLFIDTPSGYQINWVYDFYKLNDGFSSSQSVSLFLNNRETNNELFLSEM